MPVELFTRHSPFCEIRRNPKLSKDAKRKYKGCGCPIWVYGSTDRRQFPRQSTGFRDWKEAEAWLQAEVAADKNEEVHGFKVADCIQKYLDSRTDLKGKTRGQYVHLFRLLTEFLTKRNAFHTTDLSVDLLEDFKTYGLTQSDNTKSTYTAKLNHFLTEALRREWITKDLRVRSIIASYEENQPYTDDEVTRILNAALKLNGGTVGFASQPQTLRLLMELMLETGMRGGDAVRFMPSRLVKSKFLWKYAFKPQKQKKAKAKKKIAKVFLSDRLKQAIDQCEWLSKERPFAYRPVDEVNEENDFTTEMANRLYERMETIGRMTGIEDCRPHRLRDTFAVCQLLRGMGVTEVSRLLYHESVAVTEKHYATWIEQREDRMEQMLFETMREAEKAEHPG